MLDPVEEPLDQIAGPIKIRAEADGVFAISLRRNVGPSALLVIERPDPVGIIGPVRKHHCLRFHKPAITPINGPTVELRPWTAPL